MSPTWFILAWYTLPIFAYFGVRCCSERAIGIPAILFTMVCGYMLVIATVLMAGVTERASMKKFDLNRDGRVDVFERTSEAERVMRNQGNDTGLALAPVLGIPLTATWYTVLFGFLFCGDWTCRKLFVRKHIPPEPALDPEREGAGS